MTRMTCEALSRRGWMIAAFLLGSLGGAPSLAQDDRTVPSALYHSAFTPFYDGHYKDALDMFTEGGRHAIKTAESRWIDSICYHTMIGECHYQMGQFDAAMEHYTAALKLYVAFPDWMLRVQFPVALRAQSAANFRQIPWGASTRRTQPAHIPGPLLIGQGALDSAQRAVKQGGRVQMPVLFPVEAHEIARSTALAIRRRSELLGPAARYDPITQELMAALSRPVALPNHWSQAWVDAWRGLVLAGAGKDAEAGPLLLRSAVAAGQFDHTLSPTVLLELGRLELNRGNFAGALKLFHEASISAPYFDDYIVLEEALRYASQAYLAGNQKGVYAPLVPAAQWAKTSLRQLKVSLLLRIAEHLATAGLTGDADARLREAELLIGRRPMGMGWIGARLNFVRALVLYQQKRVAAGDEALAASMAYMQRGSLRLYHIAVVDARLPSFTSRAALTLFQEVLRDPLPFDWNLDPMETLASLVTPHPRPLERWFVLALQRQNQDPDVAFEVAERIRRHRFFSSLALGGRLQALRFVLDGPPELLDAKAALQRQDVLTEFPVYGQMTQQAGKIRAALRQSPRVSKDADGFQEQSRLLGQLAAISLEQEALLRQIAVRRFPANLVFPPLLSLKQVQQGLPSGHAMLAFLVAGGELHGFLLNKDKYRVWTVRGSANLARRISALLREMGNFEQNRELSLKELADPQWKLTARQILDGLLDGSGADFSKSFPELVIVPDGVLWYLPFEALQVMVDSQPYPLLARFRIRYAPTASLGVPDERGRDPAAPTVVVLGRLFPRDDESVATEAFATLAQSVPGALPLGKGPLPAASGVLASVFEKLIVLDDITESDGYTWSPIPLERAKAGSTLNDWLALPFGGPDIVILPGFHTPAENALKRMGRVPGADVFLSVCGLMSSGARTILISRWRTGGQSAFDLVREFAQELPHLTPADAWQRAVMVLVEKPLNPDAEPRIKRATIEEPPRANHPFFWAGYMLVDGGTTPQKKDVMVEMPVEPDKKPKPAKVEKKPGAQPKLEAVPEKERTEDDSKPDRKAKPAEKPAGTEPVEEKPADGPPAKNGKKKAAAKT